LKEHVARFRNGHGVPSLAGLVLLVIVAACASGPAAPPIEKVEVIPGGTVVTEPYRFEPGDDLNIKFPYDHDLNDEAIVGPDGAVELQYAGTVKLAGLTAEEAEADLEKHYAAGNITDPTVSVSVKSFAVQQIYVAGQVNSPGVVRDTVPLTLSRAIAEAGGVKLASATLSDVILVRRTPEGKVKYYKIDLSNGVTPETGDPLLTSYDLVYVPETPIAQVADFISNNLLRIIPYSYTYSSSSYTTP
jgi:protein involved in polysaccharide export with SLBB domain